MSDYLQPRFERGNTPRPLHAVVRCEPVSREANDQLRSCEKSSTRQIKRTGTWQKTAKRQYDVDITEEQPASPIAIRIRFHGKEIVVLKSQVTEKAPNVRS